MERDTLSWRHLFALVITVAFGYGAWRASQMPPEPPPEPQRPVIHIHIAAPPPSPVPPPPKPVPQPPQPTPQHVARAPVVNQPNPTMAAPPASPNPAPPSPPPANPAPPAPPVPPAPAANVNAEALYGARLHAAIEAQKHYPTSKDAMLQQPRGTVVVAVTLDRSGKLVGDPEIVTSRGGILDQAAKQSVRRAGYPPMPPEIYPGQSQHTFNVALEYTPQ